MIKKVDIKQLEVGMYVEKIDLAWTDHPFLRNSFLIKTRETIKKLSDAGIHNFYIDTSKGLDAYNAPTEKQVLKEIEEKIINVVSDKESEGKVKKVPGYKKTSIYNEINNAKKIFRETTGIIRDVMLDARLGRKVEVERLKPAIEEVSSSLLRCPDALLSLSRIKHKDDYTFEHCVSVSAIQVSFSAYLNMNEQDIYNSCIGGFLHDIGKIMMPDYILNKPAKLNDEEFRIMKSHVVETKKILDEIPGIEEIAKQIAYQHHERYDGSGYPLGLKGEQISQAGKIAAICDVYDAITSNRIYHKGITPHAALGKLLEWSDFNFDKRLVEQFIRFIGIYPVGTLVKLESGLVGVVVEQNNGAASSLFPIIKIFYSSKYGRYINEYHIDLSKESFNNKIVSVISGEEININPINLL